MATKLTQYSATSDSITARVSGWPSGTGYIRFYIGIDTSDMPFDGYEEVVGVSSCRYTFYGLEPDTAYYIKISPRAATSGQEAMEPATTVLMYTEAEEPEGRPNDWYWSATISKGAEMDYRKISDTEYEVYPLTAREWNRFIDRIFQFLVYTGGSYSGSPSSWYVTAGEEMRAEDVENVRQLIDVMNPPVSVPAKVSSGRKLTAAFFNGLKNSLNSIE